MQSEYGIIGGGVVGSAIAYGLLKQGHSVTIFDSDDGAFKASRGNFGLVWLSHKGFGAPHYAAWTRRSIKLWRELADELFQISGIDINYEQNGGYDFYLHDSEMQQTVAQYERLQAALSRDYPYEVWDRERLIRDEPAIGPKVKGAIFGPEDGHVNPLKLLRAYRKAIRLLGGKILNSVTVESIRPDSNNRYQIHLSNGQRYGSDKVVLCAGLGSVALASQLDLKAPLVPQKGQVLITEKLEPKLRRPSGIIRQVDEGGIQIGDSKESVGYDDSDTLEVTSVIAQRAIEIYPFLEDVRVVRCWGALRVISPDGLPIYQESTSYPGSFIVSCHSGITLAAAHSYLLPSWLEHHEDMPDLELFSEKRFSICEAK